MGSSRLNFRLDHLGVLSIHGSDARTFLQGQITCNIEKLSPENALLGAICNLKGRAITTFFLVQQDQETLFLIMQKELLKRTEDELKKYAVFSKVTLKNISDDYQITGIIPGENSELAKLSVFNRSPGTEDQIIFRLPGKPVHCLELSSIKAPESTTFETDLNDWRRWEALQGVILIEENSSEKFIPLDLGFAESQFQGIDFDKGCYKGQEIIARLYYRGESKFQLIRGLVTISPQDSASKPTAMNNCKLMCKTNADSLTKAGDIISMTDLGDHEYGIVGLIKKDYLPHEISVVMADEQTTLSGIVSIK